VKRQLSLSPCAAKLRILSDPTRLSVLEHLMAGSQHVGEINEKLQIEQSLLSHHLKVLRDNGLVKATRDGKSVRYSLSDRVESSNFGKAINLGCCVLAFEEEDKV
jgi:ArsR family transcriptional regulator